MAGNSQRRGATRKAGSKKGASVGTGGHGRKALEGKGPTPKAEDRPNHKAFKARVRAEKELAKQPARSSKATPRDRTSGSLELVIGRNSALEALRTGMRATTLLVFNRIDADDRVTELVSLAVEQGVEVREVPKNVLDALADGSPHQGVALEVPPFRVVGTVFLHPGSEPDRLLDRSSEMFVAVSEAAARLGDTEVSDPEVEVILVNRFYLRGVTQVDKRTGEPHQKLPGAPLGGTSWQDRAR